MLSVENVSLSFEKTAILEDVSLQLHKGKILGLIGPNGAGKTSLIRTINGSLSVDSGKIHFKKKDLTSLPPQERAQLIATVSQNRIIPAGFTGGANRQHGENSLSELVRTDQQEG